MIPADFKIRMQQLLKAEYEEFEKSFEYNRKQGLRVNTLKIDIKGFKEIAPFKLIEGVPWEKRGFYIDEEKPGKHPYHAAGLYYIQEPSAMAPVSALGIKKGDRVLDLCAAPGGKSTQAAAYLDGTGLLVSNEIDGKRAKILSGNIERLGVSNAIVTNNSPFELEKYFPSYFDKIIVDAPCSGEGMFRKDETAVVEWNSETPSGCAIRQREILNSAKKMLKPGGCIIYSTCTFSIEENEGIIDEFIRENSNFQVIDIKKEFGFSSGFGDYLDNPRINGAVRLFPHRVNGEGHFMCLLRKVDGDEKNSTAITSNLKENDLKYYYEFQRENLNININGNMFVFGDNLYRLPDEICNIRGLRVIRPGLHIGTFKKTRFEPSHSLGLYLKKAECQVNVDFDSQGEEIRDYLKGSTLNVKNSSGWCLVCTDGCSIGWGKVSNGVLKNHYPKGLRWM